MRWLRWSILAVGIVFVSLSKAAEPTASAEQEVGWQAAGSEGVVVAGGVPAVRAGLTILQEGGNAVDAAVATLLALTVTDSGACCFGGEVPIMIYDGPAESRRGAQRPRGRPAPGHTGILREQGRHPTPRDRGGHRTGIP